MRILVTGANGFVGKAVCLAADKRGFIVRTASRVSNDYVTVGRNTVVGAIDGNTDWQSIVEGCDAIVHLAARAHIANKNTSEALRGLHETNVEGTLNLARQAAMAGVKRFVFVSTIGVNGNETTTAPFSANDIPAPRSSYAISKYLAEIGLMEISKSSALKVVIIRPPLVYGASAPGRFGSLVRWLSLGFPLPLGLAVSNRRSLVALDNLVDLILACILHPNAADQVFLVSDGEDLSTAELLGRLGKALERPIRLIPMSPRILRSLFWVFGRKSLMTTFFGSLQVDIKKTRELLDWKPCVSVDEGLRRATRRGS